MDKDLLEKAEKEVGIYICPNGIPQTTYEINTVKEWAPFIARFAQEVRDERIEFSFEREENARLHRIITTIEDDNKKERRLSDGLAESIGKICWESRVNGNLQMIIEEGKSVLKIYRKAREHGSL